MLEFSIGVSALQTAQRGMEVTGNNVANANTPGYHRQIVKLAAQSPMELNGSSYGRGVEVVDVQRAVDEQLEAAITAQQTQSGYVDSMKSTMSQLQASIPIDGMSIANQLGAVFNGLQQASSQLGNVASRASVISNASALATQFNSLAASMDRMRSGLDDQLQASVDTVNSKLKQIGSLNVQIATFVNDGMNPNDLIDKRDQLVNDVAEQIPIEIQAGSHNQVTILQSGAPIVIGGTAQQLRCALNKSGQMVVSIIKGNAPLTIHTGKLGALLDARNERLPEFRQRLEDLAMEVSRALDAIQTTGTGIAGGFTKLFGQRPVLDQTVPLNAAGLSFPPQAGSLFVGMTDSATGQRTMVEIQIDPATQTLQDVANTIGAAIPHLQAYVNSQSGTLSLFATPGYKFDFAGGVDATPATSFSVGTTATATTGGVVSGAANNTYQFTFLSSGTVGVTSGLQVQVTDQTGSVVEVLDVGQGYEAGQPIKTASGVTLTLSSGTVVAGDSLSTRSIGHSDTAGILTALGLNTFFTGTDATSLKVNELLTQNPDMLSTSRTGQPGDSSNLQRFVALQDVPLMTGGRQTLSQYFNQIVTDVGTQVSSLNQQSDTNQVLMTRLREQQQGVSGVDVNEEMLEVMKFQQMFQSASKFISVVNDMYQQLFQSL